MVHSNDSNALDASSTVTAGTHATTRDALTEILRSGAQKMLKAAVEQEVSDYINDRTDIVDENGAAVCRP